MNTQNSETDCTVPLPIDPPDDGSLPHAVVFFLTKEQRRLVLRVLRAIDSSRETALLGALGIDCP
ncbi:MAG: hypothetical protein JKY96_07700 [Phycisphaerales bacterium]|nr:hypothetical protein [Phycisphaerales bacterium]